MLRVALILFTGSIFLLTSCSNKKEENKEEKKENNTEETSYVAPSYSPEIILPNMQAVMNISGMVSEIHCAGSIRKLLKAMIGVTEIIIDFNPSSDLNKAVVKFNDNKISGEEMVSAIEKLNDGAYTVQKIDIQKLNSPKITEKKNTFSNHDDISRSEEKSSGNALPGILNVFDIL